MKKKSKQNVIREKKKTGGKVPKKGPSAKKTSKKFGFFPPPSFSDSQNTYFKKIFFLAFGLILVLSILIGSQTGLNGDEMMHERYSESLFNFYKTFGEDTTALNDSKYLMHYYGSFFDVLSGAASKVIGIEIGEPSYFSVRHFFTALFGSLIMLFVGLITQYFAGWRAAVFALVMMFLSPRLLGHAAMNHKDIPFALGYVMSLYFMLTLIPQLPKPNWKNVLGLIVGIGIAVGMRAGGLLLVAYLGLFLAVDFILKYGWSGIIKKKNVTVRYLAYFIGISAGGLLFAYAFWPFGLVKPFSNIFVALKEFTNYSVDLRVLFEGKMLLAQSIPTAKYAIWWMALTIPLFSIIGLGLFIGYSKKIVSRRYAVPVLAVLFAFVFPIVYVILKDSTLYGGWRHLLFVYPMLIPVVAIGWNYAIGKMKTGWMRYGLIGIFALALLEPAYFIARNYNCSYIYFNPIAGGVKGAFGNYDHDYWGVGVKQAVKYLEKSGVLSDNRKGPLKIASNYSYSLGVYTKKYGEKVTASYVPFRERYAKEWDIGIFVGQYIDGVQLRNGTWPSGKAIHTIKVAGVPIVAIYDGQDKTAFEGEKALAGKDYPKAVQLFSREVANFPNNESAWFGLATAYTQLRDLDKAKPALDRGLEINSSNPTGLNILGMYYISKGDYQQAKDAFLKSVTGNSNNDFGFFNLALLEEQDNNLEAAIDYARKAITANPKYRQAYEILIQFYQKTGNQEEIQKCLDVLSNL